MTPILNDILERLRFCRTVPVEDWPIGEFNPGEFGLHKSESNRLFFLNTPDRLDMAQLRDGLDLEHCAALSLRHSTGSTNGDLLELGRLQSIHNVVHLAEHQSSGRGRRGRTWVSPYARSLSLSIGLETSRTIHQMQGLSLAVGVAVCLGLRSAGADACGLKWPNDVITSEGKLAGILIEHQVQNGVSQFVIGIGVNVDLSESEKSSIIQPVVDLRALGVLADRTSIARTIIQSVQKHVHQFVDGNRGDAIQAFKDLHYFQNKECVVLVGDAPVSGTVVDVAQDGSLVMYVDGELRHFLSGEVSLRPVSISR